MGNESFVHLELHGSASEVKAFVEGFRLASGEDRVYSTARENIKTDGFFSGLVARAHRSTDFIVPESFLGSIRTALEGAKTIDVKIESSRLINHAEMEFEFRCFARSDGVAIREVVESELPAGVVLEGFEVDETVDADASGAEMYSPAHEYELSGRGRYHGPVEGVILMGRRLDDQDFIHPGRIHLVYSHE